jgi:hypothetical protein
MLHKISDTDINKSVILDDFNIKAVFVQLWNEQVQLWNEQVQLWNEQMLPDTWTEIPKDFMCRLR